MSSSANLADRAVSLEQWLTREGKAEGSRCFFENCVS
jgi:hypothetical protein